MVNAKQKTRTRRHDLRTADGGDPKNKNDAGVISLGDATLLDAFDVVTSFMRQNCHFLHVASHRSFTVRIWTFTLLKYEVFL